MPILHLRTPFKPMNRPLYNQLVPYYELIEGRDWQNEINLIRSVLREYHCKSLIDLGCGTGYHTRALTRLGFHVTGIDISKENIRFARMKAKERNFHPRFVVGSYYTYRPSEPYDSALCLNWSIPVQDAEVKRFLDNTYSILQPGGLLIFDFERVSQIVWSDVGKPITDMWDQEDKLIVRVSVGQVSANVLYSRDVYLFYPKSPKEERPDERSRYEAADTRVQMYVDRSCVRFFSVKEIRHFARQSGFRVVRNFLQPRKKYTRNYVVLEKFR